MIGKPGIQGQSQNAECNPSKTKLQLDDPPGPEGASQFSGQLRGTDGNTSRSNLDFLCLEIFCFISPRDFSYSGWQRFPSGPVVKNKLILNH